MIVMIMIPDDQSVVRIVLSSARLGVWYWSWWIPCHIARLFFGSWNTNSSGIWKAIVSLRMVKTRRHQYAW